MALMGNLLGNCFDNTALLIKQDNQSEALLIDCGCLRGLGDKELTQIRTLFVSHTHLDHFIDFDFWLAAWIRAGRTCSDLGELTCFGPPGFIRNVEGHLAGYLWNLVHFRLAIVCTEIDGSCARTVRFDSPNAFSPRESVVKDLPSIEVCSRTGKSDRSHGAIVQIWSDARLKVSCATLDHGTPSLGFSIQEKPVHVVDKAALDKAGLPPGGWLKQIKEAMITAADPAMLIDTPQGPKPLGQLAKSLLREKSGQKLSFVTDTIYNKKTAPMIEALAHEADTLFIESAFLHADLAKARETYHLTARQAGRLGREAKVKKLVQFHFSSRYQGREKELICETEAALGR